MHKSDKTLGSALIERAPRRHASHIMGALGALCCLLAVALALRLLGLGERSLWFDEIMSVQFARSDWYSFVKKVSNREGNMVLYYCILRVWMHLGDSEVVIRSLSVVFSLTTIAALYALGAQLFSRRTGFFAALLMSLNAFDIRYAQEARSYSLLVLLITLASLYWVKAVDGSGDQAWRRYCAAASASVYSHFFAGLVLIAHGLSLLFIRRHPLSWQRLQRTAGVLALVTLPVAVFAVTRDKGQLEWIAPSPPSAIWTLFAHLAGGTALMAGIYGILGLYAVGTTWLPPLSTRLPDQQPDRWHLAMVLVWLVAPIALTWTASLFKPMFLDRYLIICLPALVLLAAVGLARIESHAVLTVVVIGIALATGHSLTHYYRYGMPGATAEDWRGVTRYVMSNAGAGDAIVLYPGWIQAAFAYYQPDLAESGPVTMPSASEWSGGGSREATGDGPTRRYENVWVILNASSANSARYAAEWHHIQKALADSYAEPATRDFIGLQVLRFTGPNERMKAAEARP